MSKSLNVVKYQPGNWSDNASIITLSSLFLGKVFPSKFASFLTAVLMILCMSRFQLKGNSPMHHQSGRTIDMARLVGLTLGY